MDSIKQKPFIAAVITLLILLITGCPQSHNGGNQNNVQPNPPPPSLPPPEVQESGTGNFTKDDLFTVFGLNGQKEKITASAAAKKVKDEVISSSIFTFASREALAYDDEAGTFKVKVKGHKTADTAQTFEKTFEVKGFTHPYASPPQSAIKVEFKFDAGIEENLSIDKYIEKITPNLKAHLTFSFSLQNEKAITLGYDNDYYELTAQVSNSNGELKISPEYKLKYKKSLEVRMKRLFRQRIRLQCLSLPAKKKTISRKKMFSSISLTK